MGLLRLGAGPEAAAPSQLAPRWVLPGSTPHHSPPGDDRQRGGPHRTVTHPHLRSYSAAVAEAVAKDAAARAAEEAAARKARAHDMERLRAIREEEEQELDDMRAEVTAMGEGMARMRLALVMARQEAERLAQEEKRLLQAQHRAAHQIARHAAAEGLQGKIADFMAEYMGGGGVGTPVQGGGEGRTAAAGGEGLSAGVEEA